MVVKEQRVDNIAARMIGDRAGLTRQAEASWCWRADVTYPELGIAAGVLEDGLLRHATERFRQAGVVDALNAKDNIADCGGRAAGYWGLPSCGGEVIGTECGMMIASAPTSISFTPCR